MDKKINRGFHFRDLTIAALNRVGTAS